MSDKVITFPKKRVYRREIRGREIWAQKAPPPEMVWEVCPYLRLNTVEDYRCKHCPASEMDPNYGLVQRGCYGLAAEVCRIVFAMQKRGK